MVKVIAVTGTPATGKTTVAKKLAYMLDYKYIDGKQIIENFKLHSEKDPDGTLVVPVKNFENQLKKIIKQESRAKGLIIDSHLSHLLHKELLNLCIVTRCNLKELSFRLKKRNYSEKKIADNLEAETFEICKIEAQENNLKVVEVDTGNSFEKVDYQKIVNQIQVHARK